MYKLIIGWRAGLGLVNPGRVGESSGNPCSPLRKGLLKNTIFLRGVVDLFLIDPVFIIHVDQLVTQIVTISILILSVLFLFPLGI